jgi:hypothetical protein
MPGSSASSRQILLPLDLITDAADIGAACGHDLARALSIAKRRRTVGYQHGLRSAFESAPVARSTMRSSQRPRPE